MNGESCCNKQNNQTTSKSSFCCPITGFRFCLNGRLIVAAAILIVWTNIFAWIWHGNFMANNYMETASLWRPDSEMNIGALNGGLALIGFVAAYIFMKGYEGTGWREGLRFGILITLLFFGCGLIQFATQPIPFKIIGLWALGDLISYSLGGIILTRVFARKGSPAANAYA